MPICLGLNHSVQRIPPCHPMQYTLFHIRLFSAVVVFPSACLLSALSLQTERNLKFGSLVHGHCSSAGTTKSAVACPAVGHRGRLQLRVLVVEVSRELLHESTVVSFSVLVWASFSTLSAALEYSSSVSGATHTQAARRCCKVDVSPRNRSQGALRMISSQEESGMTHHPSRPFLPFMIRLTSTRLTCFNQCMYEYLV